MPPQPLRLAVYGHLNRDAGSSAASHYLLVEEMLRRGHFVDLYAIDGFVTPQDLARFPNLTYRPASLALADGAFRFCYTRLPRRVGAVPSFLVNTARHRAYYQRLAGMIRRRHRERPYDALLVLDLFSNPFPRIDRLPCVVWMQAAHRTELDAVLKQKRTIISLCGRAYYWALVAYYRCKVAVSESQVRLGNWDHIVACSRWNARAFLDIGVPPRRLSVLPFMLDMARFRPAASWEGRGRQVVFLHLGRVVPRKRLDLLLEAFARLRAEDPDVSLLLIGRFAYAHGYRRLLGLERMPPGVEYRTEVPRAEVPELLRSVDVLVQPSENETFGSSVMEALGSGVPVVAGPTNGTAEYAPRDFLFDAHTPESLLAAMRRCAAAVRADRAAVARQARQAAEAAFDVASVTGRFVELVRRAGSAPRPRAKAVRTP